MNDIATSGVFCDTTRAELIATPQANAKGAPVNIEPAIPKIDAVEAMMLDAEQIECPVTHHFGPGIYIREVFMPAGAYVMGHAHKCENMNVMIKGKMAVCVDGEAKVIEGPCIFTGGPGRKFAYIIEDTIFQNIYATTETDVDVLESMFVEKSDAWTDAQARALNADAIESAVGKYFQGVSS